MEATDPEVGRGQQETGLNQIWETNPKCVCRGKR